ncbi:MAG TPA: CoA transferase [Nitrososphaerales archaeon]|nr:CoA transferase [Nitrososphaerales archaeon]
MSTLVRRDRLKKQSPDSKNTGIHQQSEFSTNIPSSSGLGELRVLELSQAIAGPTVTQILADYGASVVKVERPRRGDIFRDVPGMGPSMFLAVNRGKKSVAIDLKTKKGLDLLYGLMKWCDVFVENLSPGTAESMGVTYDKSRRVNKGMIFCRVQSFGRGPMEDVPAFDPVLQAATGIMSTTGFPPDRFARAGVSIVDMSTGMHAAIAILFMLLRREKTGKGGLLEVSLYDSAAYFMSYWVTRLDLTGRDTLPLGSTHIFGAPYNLFKTSDGWIYIAVAGDSDWASFCRALGFDDLLSLKKYHSNDCRVKNKAALEKLVGSRITRMKTSDLQEKLRRARVPSSVLNTTKGLLKDSHFTARNLLETYVLPNKKESRKLFRTIVNPAIIDGKRVHTEASPPRLGDDTASVMKDLLRLDSAKIRKLVSDKIIQIAD